LQPTIGSVRVEFGSVHVRFHFACVIIALEIQPKGRALYARIDRRQHRHVERWRGEGRGSPFIAAAAPRVAPADSDPTHNGEQVSCIDPDRSR
jgi:hypothetical protein